MLASEIICYCSIKLSWNIWSFLKIEITFENMSSREKSEWKPDSLYINFQGFCYLNFHTIHSKDICYDNLYYFTFVVSNSNHPEFLIIQGESFLPSFLLILTQGCPLMAWMITNAMYMDNAKDSQLSVAMFEFCIQSFSSLAQRSYVALIQSMYQDLLCICAVLYPLLPDVLSKVKLSTFNYSSLDFWFSITFEKWLCIFLPS